MESKTVSVASLGNDYSLRNDYKYLKYFLNEKGDVYFSELFDVVNLSSVDISCLDAFKYCQIGDVNNSGDIFPVDIDFGNQDLSLVDYYKKINNGDICKPKKGDILISKVRPYLKKFVFIDDSNDEVYFTTAFICLRPKFKPLTAYYIIRNYLFSLLNSVSRQGKGYPTLSPEDIKNLKINSFFIKKLASFKDDSFIEKKHNQIKFEQKNLKNKLLIINDVFSSSFGFSADDYLKIQKGLTFGTQNSNKPKIVTNLVNFSSLSINYNLRDSYRSQNPIINEIDSKIRSEKFLKVKDVLLEPVHRGSAPDYADAGIPVIKTAHLKSEEISKEFSQFVLSKTIRSEVKKGDILLASTGKPSIGKIDLIKDDDDYVCDGHVSIIRIDEKKYSREFFTYLFRSVYGYSQIERDVVGCTNQVELYPIDIENFLLPDISIDSQRKIVFSINEKMEQQDNFARKIDSIRKEIDKTIFTYFESNIEED